VNISLVLPKVNYYTSRRYYLEKGDSITLPKYIVQSVNIHKSVQRARICVLTVPHKGQYPTIPDREFEAERKDTKKCNQMLALPRQPMVPLSGYFRV
jgi:hypothetical protein